MKILIFLTFASLSIAQTWRGSVIAQVEDSSQSLVAGSRLTLRNIETNKLRSGSTGSDGTATFGAVPPGNYELEADKAGFGKSVRSFAVLVNQEVRVAIRLQPGTQPEKLEVQGAAELLKTDSAAISTVIETTLIRQLPLDGRNFYELSLLAPGTAPSAQGSAGSVRGEFAIHVNGAREDANNFVLDGVYNGDPKLNRVGVTPPVDAIREFEVLTIRMMRRSVAMQGAG
ncbi:MAG: carboxypeptidase-like regulatory domain-containing protein [Bryobacteraceae bacterium]